jgi:SAM-dependent methyltransferase
VAATGADVELIRGSIGDVQRLTHDAFDAICCHAVLMYVHDAGAALEVLRSIAREGATLSLLEKNRNGLALRPGFRGDFEEALRVLDSPVAAGNLGIQNRSRSLGEWRDCSMPPAGGSTRSWGSGSSPTPRMTTCPIERSSNSSGLNGRPGVGLPIETSPG